MVSDSDLSNRQDNSPLHLTLVRLRSEHSTRRTTPHLSLPRRQTGRAARHVLRATLATAASLPPLSTSSSLHLKLRHIGFTSEHGLVSTAAPHQTPSRLALNRHRLAKSAASRRPGCTASPTRAAVPPRAPSTCRCLAPMA